MSAFLKAFDHMLAWETGNGRVLYTNDPRDPGRETYCGISRRWFPQWIGWGIVERNFVNGQYQSTDEEKLRAMVKTFYKDNVWDRWRCDRMPQVLATDFFDCCTVPGGVWAGKFVQRSLNVLNNGGSRWPDLQVDGVVGMFTHSALRTFEDCCEKSIYLARDLLETFRTYREYRFIEIAEANPSMEVFSLGWHRRARGEKP